MSGKKTLFLTAIAATSFTLARGAEEAKPEPTNEVSIFPDKNLEKAVRKVVFEKRDTDKPILAADVANISTIQGAGMGITDLTGLEKCVSLASLDLPKNSVTNLTPLKGLERLQFLNLAKNQIDDTSPLAGVKALQYIELSDNKVKDVKALEGLTNMASLYLSTNQITDIDPLTHFPKISSLYLQKNQLKSMDGLERLHGLFTLSVSENEITDLTPVKGLTNLFYLFIENNKISDLKPLVESAKADTERRFAPYLNFYFKGNPLNQATAGEQLETLKAVGVRLNK